MIHLTMIFPISLIPTLPSVMSLVHFSLLFVLYSCWIQVIIHYYPLSSSSLPWSHFHSYFSFSPSHAEKEQGAENHTIQCQGGLLQDIPCYLLLQHSTGLLKLSLNWRIYLLEKMISLYSKIASASVALVKSLNHS